jgi:protein O-GlcNAc transferase
MSMKIKIQANKKDLKQSQYIFNMGNEYKRQGKLDDAIDCYKKVIALTPKFAGAYHNLGNVLREKGRIDEAMACYRKAIELAPDVAVTYNNLGNVLQEKGQVDDSIEFYKKALQCDPDYMLTYLNLGIALGKKGQISRSIEYLRKALQYDPHSAIAYDSLGSAYLSQGEPNNAEDSYRRALQIDPRNSSVYSNLLFSLNYNPRYDAEAILKEHLQFANKFGEPSLSIISSYANERNPDRRLRIGYISPDFRRHAVAYFIEPVLNEHNHDHFEIFCYSNSLIQDEVTKRIQEHADQWHKVVGMSDEEVAELIRKEEIDILVDLAGHTAGNRILVFARKPAPIQVSWIGYLATTGLSTMDYKISDNYADPSGKTEQFYTEKLLRLPGSFLCYLPDKESPDVNPLPALSKGHTTFGSFNNFAKMNAEVFSLWAKILNELPDSDLILKAKSFHDVNTCQYAINMFGERGIAAERITLQPSDPAPKYLQSYNLVDIGLDTFPFNGATTTCEAMWMGVPVITLAGTSYHSRSGVSALSNVGLTRLIANSPDEYISIAVNLSKDLRKLQSLREHLRGMMKDSPLCNAKGFTADLEKCYRSIWEEWCRSVQ